MPEVIEGGTSTSPSRRSTASGTGKETQYAYTEKERDRIVKELNDKNLPCSATRVSAR